MVHFKNKSILLISPEPWAAHHVSKHHYAKTLAKENQVFFLNPFSSKKKISKINDTLKIVDWNFSLKGIRFFPPFLQAITYKKEINKIEKFCGTSFDVIWNFDPSRFFNLTKVQAYSICHIVDFNQGFQRNTLATTSDITFVTSNFLHTELRKYNQKTFKIHHGYQLVENSKNFSLPKTKLAVKVAMIGNLTRKCIDWKSIVDIITANTDVQFYFIGAYNQDIFQKINYSNVYWLGKVDASYLPTILDHIDISLCAYKIETEEDIVQHANLHKHMEYLASGKVLVSSYVDEYKNKAQLLEMVMPNEDIVERFAQIVSKLEIYNSEEKQRARKKFALAHSYKKQLEKINQLIETITIY